MWVKFHRRFCSYHVVGAVSGGLVFRRRDTLLGVAVAEAASFHYQVVDGKVLNRKRFPCRGESFDLAGARLVLQQPNSDVGHLQLLLALQTERIQRLPLWEGSINSLAVRERCFQLMMWNATL